MGTPPLRELRNGKAVLGCTHNGDLTCPGQVSEGSWRTACLRRQSLAPDFQRLRRDIHEPPVPVAPARSLLRRGSATDGATRIVGDNVAALPHSDLEQFRTLSGVWLLHDGHLCMFGWINGSRALRHGWRAVRP